jgi:CDP-paratose 2-epimerase
VREAVRDADSVVHLAAQVAVTTSLQDPRFDFDVNAAGTLNVLEAMRGLADPPPLVFASTNKVYGALEDVALLRLDDRYEPENAAIRRYGVGEARPLDFHSPYGCSKGVADQYVRDYTRVFGLRTTVLRMSCIYGPRQFGTEDQGWVAHFLIKALRGEPITIFGDGRQVRDVLHINDAVAAYRACLAAPDKVTGRIYNLGGGAANAVSLRRVLDAIQALAAAPVAIGYDDWRPGDQPYYVSDTRAFRAATGWRPRVPWRDGLKDLAAWLAAEGLVPERALKPERVAV